MSFVPFNSEDIKAVMDGSAPIGTVFAVLTSQTCGEPCWHAREEICRCSCGGRNHGCLNHGDKRPERTSRIDGYVYRLKAVGKRGDVYSEACEINRQAGFKGIGKPTIVIDSVGSQWTEADAAKARLEGKEVWYNQYTYCWQTTDCGAPARLKTPSQSQRNWQELSGWKDERDVYLLWERLDKPVRPTELIIDLQTGAPVPDAMPRHCY